VQQHVIARQEGLDLRIHGDAGFLPQQVGHCRSPMLSISSLPGEGGPTGRMGLAKKPAALHAPASSPDGEELKTTTAESRGTRPNQTPCRDSAAPASPPPSAGCPRLPPPPAAGRRRTG